MMLTRNKPYLSYLNGVWTEQGHWYYYLEAFVLKNTPFLLMMFFFGIHLMFKLRRRIGLPEALMFVPILFFFHATLGDKSNAGIRYFLPIYPFVFIIAAGALTHIQSKHLLIPVLFISGHILSAVVIWPNHLTYFSVPKGYKYLRDSNFDWGQGLIQIRDKVGDDPIILNYPWAADPTLYGLNWTKYEAMNKTGLYAVSGHAVNPSITLAPNIGGMFLYECRLEESPP